MPEILRPAQTSGLPTARCTAFSRMPAAHARTVARSSTAHGNRVQGRQTADLLGLRCLWRPRRREAPVKGPHPSLRHTGRRLYNSSGTGGSPYTRTCNTLAGRPAQRARTATRNRMWQGRAWAGRHALETLVDAADS